MPIPRPNVAVGAKCITTAQVTVTYPHPFIFVGGIVDYFGHAALATKTLSARSTMRAEVTAGACP